MSGSAAKRMRRLRERRDAGKILLRFEANESVVELLVDSGYLAPIAADQPEKINAAAAALFDALRMAHVQKM